MIISSMNFKGGTGKTMVCTNLAAAFAQLGKKVCLVDTDESFASTKWAGRREEREVTPSIPVVQMIDAKTIVSSLRQLNKDNDIILVDAPPRLNPLVSKIILLSDLVIIPVPPKSGNDREVTEDFLQRFESIQEQRTDGERTYAQPELLEARDALVEGILNDIGRIADGQTLPALGEGSACDFCKARGLCRKDFWS